MNETPPVNPPFPVEAAPAGPQCGSQPLDTAGPCAAGEYRPARLPQWARGRRERPLLTRQRLIAGGVLLLILAFILWLNYPFLPDFRVLLFNRPTTQLSSDSLPGQWAMDGGDLAQTKSVPAIAGGGEPLTGQALWSVPLGENSRSGPIVHNGRVYLGGHFQVSALDAATGKLLWQQPTTGPVQGSLAAAGDYLFMGLQDHRLHALDAASGQSLWQFKAQDAITSAPIAHQGIVYFGSWDGRQYAVDAATGEAIWNYAATGIIGLHPALHDGILAFGDRNGRFHLLDARTGQNRLLFRTPKSATAASVIAHDLVYFPAGGRLYALDATAKEIPGQYQFKRVWAQLWLWKIPGVPRPATQQGGRWRFNPDGEESRIVAAPAASAGRLFVGDLNGRLYTLDALTGRELQRSQLDGGLYAPPLLVGNRVYAATQKGYLYALDAATGQSHWRLNLNAPVNQPMAYAAGILYIRTSDGVLHTVK